VPATQGPERVAYYSLLRFVPDALRDEPINVGLFLVSEDGDWARFDARVPKTRLASVNRRSEADRIEEWASVLRERFEAEGYPGLFNDRERLTRAVLDEWAQSFSATLRISEPRVAVERDLDRLWQELFSRLVRTARQTGSLAGHEAPPLSAPAEKRGVVREFVNVARRWPTFDHTRLRYNRSFTGRYASHFADLAILNGHVTGIMQAIPLSAGSPYEIVATRAMLLEAAVDLDADVAKLALYRDPPPEKRDLLVQTTSVINEAGRGIKLVPSRSFGALEAQLANTLFPPGEDASV